MAAWPAVAKQGVCLELTRCLPDGGLASRWHSHSLSCTGMQSHALPTPLPAGGTFTATVWRTDAAAAMLHQQAQLTTGQQAETTRQVLWREQQADQVLTIQEDRWRLWSLEGGKANVRPLLMLLQPGARLSYLLVKL